MSSKRPATPLIELQAKTDKLQRQIDRIQLERVQDAYHSMGDDL